MRDRTVHPPEILKSTAVPMTLLAILELVLNGFIGGALLIGGFTVKSAYDVISVVITCLGFAIAILMLIAKKQNYIAYNTYSEYSKFTGINLAVGIASLIQFSICIVISIVYGGINTETVLEIIPAAGGIIIAALVVALSKREKSFNDNDR